LNCNTKLDTAAVNSTANKHGNRTLHKFQSEIQLPVGKTMVLSVAERTFGVIQKRNKRKQKERNNHSVWLEYESQTASFNNMCSIKVPVGVVEKEAKQESNNRVHDEIQQRGAGEQPKHVFVQSLHP